jgi:hypothetical protein
MIVPEQVNPPGGNDIHIPLPILIHKVYPLPFFNMERRYRLVVLHLSARMPDIFEVAIQVLIFLGIIGHEW